MRKFWIAAVAVSGLVLGGASLQAKDKEDGVSGILIDSKCSMKEGKVKSEEDAAGHPAACAIKCADSGLGVIHGDKWIKLDEKGQKLAKEYLEKHKDDEGATKVHVAGKVSEDGKMIAVEEIHAQSAEKKS